MDTSGKKQMVFNSLPSVTQELNNFFHQINKLTRFARSFVYFCEKNYLIPSLLRVRELKTICFFPSVSNDTFVKLFTVGGVGAIFNCNFNDPIYLKDHLGIYRAIFVLQDQDNIFMIWVMIFWAICNWVIIIIHQDRSCKR